MAKGFSLKKLSPDQIDRRILFWILTLIICWPYIRPIGLPLLYQRQTVDAFEYINRLATGTLVMFSLDTTGGAWPEMGASSRMLLDHLVSRNMKIVVAGFALADASVLQEMVFKDVGIAGRMKYGVDYVGFGFVPGSEVAMAQLAVNFRTILKADLYGNPIEKLPLMNGINGAKDFGLLVTIDSTVTCLLWFRQWSEPFKVPTIVSTTAGSWPQVTPFYTMGMVKGALAGLRGAGEYEKMLNKPGEGVKSVDMLSLSTIYMVVMVALGNIAYFMQKRRKA